MLNRFTCFIIRSALNVFCRYDRSKLDKVPLQGPFILVANHIGSLEVPLIYVNLFPRRMTGFAKIESWKNPLFSWLFNMWNAIPIRRGEADLNAIKRGLQALEDKKILAIAPEGTRSRGKLIRGESGVSLIAIRSGAPIVPLAHWGGENFRNNLRKLRSTRIGFKAGPAFKVNTGGIRITPEIRQAVVDEIMCQLALLLPHEYRGAYADIPVTTKYLRFL
jgi:1-acyl-sn-glycerol-3-phosphate acyltransferase